MPLKGGDRHGNYLTSYITGNQTFSIPLGAATRLQMGFYYKSKCSVLLLFKKSVSHEGTMKYSHLGFMTLGNLWEAFFSFFRGSTFIQSSPRETLSSPTFPSCKILKGDSQIGHLLLNPFIIPAASFMGIQPQFTCFPTVAPPRTDCRSSLSIPDVIATAWQRLPAHAARHWWGKGIALHAPMSREGDLASRPEIRRRLARRPCSPPHSHGDACK